MTTCLRLLLPTATALLPLVGWAQASPPSPRGIAPTNHRFYVGLAAATGSAASPDGFSGTPTTPITQNRLPLLPRLTVGWQLSSRLALQLSAQYAHQNDTYDYVEGRTDANGQPYLLPGSRGFRFHSLAVPVLARYTVTHNLARRLQVDVLGGVTLVRRFTQYHDVLNIPAFSPTQPAIPVIDYNRANTGVHVSLGPSLRYRLGPQLELTGEVTANYLVNPKDVAADGFNSATPTTQLGFSSSLGLRYRFGGR